MSRLERHKQRREGQVTGIGKKDNISLIDETEFEESYNINPIVEPEKKVEALRKRVIEQPKIDPKVCVEDLKENAVRTKTELFDIDQAFIKLRQDRIDPQNDTQLDIMTGIFSESNVEYNDTAELKKEPEAEEMISEEELMKLLEKKEKNHIKKVAKKRKKEKRYIVEDIDTTEPYLKEELIVDEVSEANDNDSIKKRIDIKNGLDDFESSLTKKNLPLIIVLVVLVLVLAFLVYNFISK